MDIVLFIILMLAIIVFLSAMLLRTKPAKKEIPLPGYIALILQEHVLFYQKLNESEKDRFARRVNRFLLKVKVTGVNTTVEDLDRVLIGASAVIPIFRFPDWEYTNIKEILLYPDSFDNEFRQEGAHRNTLGMVGTGALNSLMLLSQHALREGFSNKTDKNNTAIHEFVHLIDKTDGDTDGIPALLLQHQCTIPWINLMHKNIQAIQKGKSDINPYGATNNAEFFAVASEYFFERPMLLKTKHPQLYEMLNNMFHQTETPA